MPEFIHPFRKNSHRKSKFSYCLSDLSQVGKFAPGSTTISPSTTLNAEAGPSRTDHPFSVRPSNSGTNPGSTSGGCPCPSRTAAGKKLAAARNVLRSIVPFVIVRSDLLERRSGTATAPSPAVRRRHSGSRDTGHTIGHRLLSGCFRRVLSLRDSNRRPLRRHGCARGQRHIVDLGVERVRHR